MIKLERPEFTQEEVYETCISRVRDRRLKDRLGSVTALIVEASEEYIALASRVRLHQFAQADRIGGIVTGEEMEAVYTQRMAKKKAPGRKVYDEIYSSAPRGKCPLCGHRVVSTLDHHLPKSQYPVLSVVPVNLVPACADCNKAKLASLPRAAAEEALHPYFDDIGRDRWLVAEVVQGNLASVKFRVAPPEVWSEELSERVVRYFRTLDLATLYSAEAADEVVNIRHQLVSMFEAGGARTVRAEMVDREESARHANLNGWRTAMFAALAESEWFCAGGFNDF